jgi:hypothetical protein
MKPDVRTTRLPTNLVVLSSIISANNFAKQSSERSSMEVEATMLSTRVRRAARCGR